MNLHLLAALLDELGCADRMEAALRPAPAHCCVVLIDRCG